MKTFNLILLACLILGFTSCQKEEIYSCDENVNKWVKRNLTEIRAMTRSEWKNLDEHLKKGCYVAFTPQQKVDFWKGKFDESLALEWSQEEAEHIKLMRNFVDEHPDYFDLSIEKTDKEIETFEIFVYKWIKKAEQELKWNKQIINGLIATGNHLLDKQGTIQTNLPKVMTKAGGETECNCNTESDWCSIGDCMESHSCDGTNHGCGTLWVYSCNGLCNGI